MVTVAEDLAGLWQHYAGRRDPDARERLLVHYLPLVRHVVGRLSVRLPSGCDYSDLESYGVLGLMEALDRFDGSRGNQFETYASVRIRGSVIDFLRSAGTVSRSHLARARRLEDAIAALQTKLGRNPSERELAEHLGLAEEALHDQLSQVAPVLVSLNSQLVAEDGEALTLADTIVDPNAVDPAQTVDDEETVNDLAGAIDLLPERERLVVSLYYHDGLTMREISQVLGVTEPRVSQLHTAAVLRLRASLRQRALRSASYVA
jgi:RNA polymerase sigma factor FliA